MRYFLQVQSGALVKTRVGLQGDVCHYDTHASCHALKPQSKLRFSALALNEPSNTLVLENN